MPGRRIAAAHRAATGQFHCHLLRRRLANLLVDDDHQSQSATRRADIGAYQSVKRFTRKLAHKLELPFRRKECEPGDELQIDFCCGAWIKEDGRRRRRPHLFRAVHSHSRHGYSEVVWRQDTMTLIRCGEKALRSFSGVTATLVPDNLKAAVLRPDWFDPESNPKLRLL